MSICVQRTLIHILHSLYIHMQADHAKFQLCNKYLQLQTVNAL